MENMTLEIRHAVETDLPVLAEIFAYARAFMARSGNPNQWKTNRPSMEAVKRDIACGNFYVVLAADTIVGCFAFIVGPDLTYHVIEEGSWISEEPYGTIHRIAGNGRASGLFETALSYCKSICRNIRIDTHPDNAVMRHLIEKNGFTYCGIIYTDDGTKRMAFQNTGETE